MVSTHKLRGLRLLTQKAYAMPRKSIGLLIASVLCLPVVLVGQDKVVIVRHGSTPEGDITRARADAVLLLRQAQLVGEKAHAQRLENLIRECDVAYKQFSTLQQDTQGSPRK